MTKTFPIKLSLAILLCLTFSTCKKKEIPNDPEKPVQPAQPGKPENPKSETKTYVPISLVTDNEKIEFKYADDGIQLTEIKYGTGIREVISYKDKKPREYRRYIKDELIYTVDYILNSEGMVVTANRYQVEYEGKVLIPLGNYLISYNEDKMIADIKWFDFKNKLTANLLYNYDDNHLLIGTTTGDVKPGVMKYSYDGKPGLLKNTNASQLFAIENEAFFLRNVKSNLTALEDQSDATKNLQINTAYDVDGSPLTFSVTNGSKKTIYKITYR